MIDFLVVGGGIAGLSAAARLSEHGRTVVLERETQIGYHASGRSAAMFEPTYGSEATRALNEASADWHLNTNRSAETQRGLLLLGSVGNEAAFAADEKSMKMERLSLSEAQDLVPILDTTYVTQAAFHREAYDVDTDAALQWFARQLRQRGGKVVTGAEVTQITRTDAGWRVMADTTYEAQFLINASGAWADELAAMAGIAPIGLQPLRRSMARVAAPDGHDVSRWPMLFGPGEEWYAKPDAGALLISPADEDPVPPQDAWAENMTLAEGIERYQPHVTSPVTRMIANWAGLRSFAPDRELALGPSRSDKQFIWSAAQGGYGFQTAPAAGRLVADLVTGTRSELPPEVIATVRADRFGPH